MSTNSNHESLLITGNHVIIDNLKPPSKMVLQIIVDNAESDENFQIDKLADIFVKLNVNDGKFNRSIAGNSTNEWHFQSLLIIHMTTSAHNYLRILAGMKHEIGLRVRLITGNGHSYIDLTKPIGKFKRIITNINDPFSDTIENDPEELQGLTISKWRNIIPCEKLPDLGYKPQHLVYRLLILYSALQRYSDTEMSELQLPTVNHLFSTYESMFEYFASECLIQHRLQSNLDSLNPIDDYKVYKNTLLFLGSILIRLHTKEQLDKFQLIDKHECIFKDGCPLNILVKIRPIHKGSSVSINSIIKLILSESFKSLTDFNNSHLERLLEMNFLITDAYIHESLRLGYFQLFERIAQIDDLYAQLPHFFKFDEVINAQRFLSTMDK